MFCVYRFHSAGHLLIKPNSTASFCALAARCNIRSLLSTAWAHLQGLAGKCLQLLHCICSQLHSGAALYNKLALAVESLSSSVVFAGMPEQ